MKIKFVVCIILCFALVPVTICEAAYDSKDLLKQGLLGAGSGAAASAASGGNAGTGALVGAGVNVLGGALLDSLTERPQQTQQAQSYQTRRQAQPTYREQQSYGQPKDAYSTGYEDGYSNGYKAGYTAGYKEGLKEAYKNE